MCFSSRIMKWIHLFWSDVHTELMSLGELPGFPREQTPKFYPCARLKPGMLLPTTLQKKSHRQQNPNDAWKISCDPEKTARTWNPPGEVSRAKPKNFPSTALKHFWDCQELGDVPWRLRDFLPFFPAFLTNASNAVIEASSPARWAELSSQSCVKEQLHPN